MAFPDGWKYQALVTVPAANVVGASNLSDFPVTLTRPMLPYEMFDPAGDPCQVNGGDIRATLDQVGTVQLPLEVVSVALDASTNDGTGQAELHVLLPTLYAATATTFYIWWDHGQNQSQPAVTDAYGRNSVWPGFYGVYHFHNLNKADSTGQQVPMTLNQTIMSFADDGVTATSVAGHIGADALQFQEFLQGQMTGWPNPGVCNELALSCVFRARTSDITVRRFRKPMYLQADNLTSTFNQWVRLSTGSGGSNAPYGASIRAGGSKSQTGDGVSPAVLSDLNWAHVGATYQGAAGMEFTANATADGPNSNALANPNYGNGTFPRFDLGIADGFNTGDGVVDEARIRTSGVSIETLQTEGNNLKVYPTNFATSGPAIALTGATDATATATGIQISTAAGVTIELASSVAIVSGLSASLLEGLAAVAASASVELTGQSAVVLAQGVDLSASSSISVTGEDLAGGATGPLLSASAALEMAGLTLITVAGDAIGSVSVSAEAIGASMLAELGDVISVAEGDTAVQVSGASLTLLGGSVTAGQFFSAIRADGSVVVVDSPTLVAICHASANLAKEHASLYAEFLEVARDENSSLADVEAAYNRFITLTLT